MSGIETITLPAGFLPVARSAGISEYRYEPSGLRVLVLPQAGAPVVTFMVTYHVGSRNEWNGLTGATHFLEHLMFKGTERFHGRHGTSIFNTLQRVGARINATTWFDRTNYYELLPREHLGLAMEIEADRMRNALLDPGDVESERTVILNEMDRGENDASRMLYQQVWATAYQAHPYHHPTIGWRGDVQRVTADGLRHFYDTYYWPDNATATIIGDITPEDALRLVEQHFGPVPASSNAIRHDVTPEPTQQGERRLTVEQVGQLGTVMIAYKSPPALDADTDALDVLCTILGNGKDSRLYRHLTDRGLVSGAYASASRLRDPGLTYFRAFLAPERTHEEVEAAIYEILADVARGGIRTSELERAITQLSAQVAFSRDGSFGIAAQLNEAIAAGDWRLYADYIDRIRRVSPEDVQRVASQYFTERTRTVGWYVPNQNSPR